MNLRLKTNQDTEEKLSLLQGWLHLSSKAAVMRIGMSLSLKDGANSQIVNGEAEKKYDLKYKDGADYMRLTIFGDYEPYYRLLMENHLNRKITDDEFFPALTSFHIERGVATLFSEYRYVNDKNKLIAKLLNL